MALFQCLPSGTNPTIQVPCAHEEQYLWVEFFENIQKAVFRRAFHLAPGDLFTNALCIHSGDGFFPGWIDGQEDAFVQCIQGVSEFNEEVSGAGKQVRLEDARDLFSRKSKSGCCYGPRNLGGVVCVVIDQNPVFCPVLDFEPPGYS